MTMAWELKEAIQYYKRQGAPGDQTAVISLLREVQQEQAGIPVWMLTRISEELGVKESFLQAVIRRIPSLRLQDTHCLELCCGPNCGKHRHLAEVAEKLQTERPGKFTVKYSGCMRLCGKGPNLKWDGVLYHRADENLLRTLVEKL